MLDPLQHFGGPARAGSPRVAPARVGRRRWHAGSGFLECFEDLGVRQRLGHLNVGLDLDGRAELFHAQVLLLGRDQHDAHVDVRARRDRVLV